MKKDWTLFAGTILTISKKKKSDRLQIQFFNIFTIGIDILKMYSKFVSNFAFPFITYPFLVIDFFEIETPILFRQIYSWLLNSLLWDIIKSNKLRSKNIHIENSKSMKYQPKRGFGKPCSRRLNIMILQSVKFLSVTFCDGNPQ